MWYGELDKQASEHHFQVLASERLAYYPEKNVMKLMAKTSRDINDLFGQTWVYIDASTGNLIGFYLPTGKSSGDTFTTWITTLHIARIWGIPYRVLATLTALAIITLSITGVVIWWRKRRARISAARIRGKKSAFV